MNYALHRIGINTDPIFLGNFFSCLCSAVGVTLPINYPLFFFYVPSTPSFADIILYRSQMVATTLPNLSAEALTAILDLLNSSSVLRLLFVGNSLLSTKVYANTRSLNLVYNHTKRFPTWPTFIAHFTSLLRVSITATEVTPRRAPIPVKNVDLTTLPSTLRSLELNFIKGHFLIPPAVRATPSVLLPTPGRSRTLAYSKHLNVDSVRIERTNSKTIGPVR